MWKSRRWGGWGRRRPQKPCVGLCYLLVLPFGSRGYNKTVSGGGHQVESGGTRSHEGGGRKEHACFCAGVNGESRRGTGVGCKFGWMQDEIHFCIHERSRFDRFGRLAHRLV
jgi:hypothetical protein